MKKQFITLLGVLFCVITFAQTVPQGINYQAVARDANGNELTNQSITIQLSLLESSMTGIVSWQETHSVTTNDFGLFNLVIGQGVSTGVGYSLNFSDVDWGAEDHYVKVEMDLGNGYLLMGTNQLMSVPYALAAANSGGAFSTSVNITSNAPGDYSTDDFLFGSSNLDNNSNINHDGRMFFDKSKSAFRVGQCDNTNWDEVNIGSYSFASGFNTIASGNYSTAMGHYTHSKGIKSTAMGIHTKAIGKASTSTGYYTLANSYASFVLGRYNVGGGTKNSWVTTDPLFEIGNGSSSSIRSNAFTVYKNGNAVVQNSLTANVFDGDGSLLTNLDWTEISNIPNDIADGDDIGGGAFSTSLNITSNAPGDYSIDDFLFGSSSLDYDGVVDHNKRMFFDKSKGAFRVGQSSNLNWDADSLGLYSFASGSNTKASGNMSIAAGNSTIASGNQAVAMGRLTKATGANSTAMGYLSESNGHHSTAIGHSTVATGDYSTALGILTDADSYGSFVIGKYNVGGGSPGSWVSTDPLFEVGNGSSTIIGSHPGTSPSNAFTVYKNGNAVVQDTLTANMFVGDGSLLTNVNGGSFLTSLNVTSNSPGDYSADDFVFGSTTLDYNTQAPISSLPFASRMFFDKSKSAFRVGACNGVNWNEVNIGSYSFAAGFNTKATGNLSSISIGYVSEATGNSSCAIGYYTNASGNNSTAMGSSTTASGSFSTAMGSSTTASGDYSIAMGHFTNATGITSTAMGNNTYASGDYSTAKGYYTFASGDYSNAMGLGSEAIGDYSTSMGYFATATGIGELYNSGNVKGLSFISTSDRRVKQNILPLEDALDKVMQLNAKTYYYNTEEFPRFESEKDNLQIGFIAQEVEAILPEMVVTDGDDVALKGIRYGQLTAVLVEAIKEQQKMIERLETQNNNLESRIEQLETN